MLRLICIFILVCQENLFSPIKSKYSERLYLPF